MRSILYFLATSTDLFMKKMRVYLFVGLFTLLSAVACTDSNFLFQENSNSWETFGNAQWNFSKDVLIGKSKDGSGFVMTKKTYKDFVLELEFKPDSTINSGVFIRCSKKELSATDCHEINIWDLHPNQENRTGAIVAKSVPLNHVTTLNKWNTYKIKAEKDSIQVWVNNILMADSKYEYPIEGFIGLQAMGTGEILFRSIRLSKIK